MGEVIGINPIMALRDDDSLIREAAGGTQTAADALDTLIRRHYENLHKYIRYRTQSTDLADDLTQEVFLRVTRSISTYNFSGKFTNFLLTVAKNAIADYYRRKRQEDELNDELPDSGDPHSNSELRCVLDDALSKLSEKQRECVMLRTYGFKLREIAAMENETLSAVKSRYHQSMKRLREILGDVR